MVHKSDKRLHKLKYWREKVGLKQEDLAVLLGCKRSNYCQKETGKAEIRLSEMLKIQKAINRILVKMDMPEISLDEMFT
jgi:DNA-binding XRE family transcriptional regulator